MMRYRCVVSGLRCGGCVRTIRSALSSLAASDRVGDECVEEECVHIDLASGEVDLIIPRHINTNEQDAFDTKMRTVISSAGHFAVLSSRFEASNDEEEEEKEEDRSDGGGGVEEDIEKIEELEAMEEDVERRSGRWRDGEQEREKRFHRVGFRVHGMSCGACVLRVENVMRARGALRASVSLATSSAQADLPLHMKPESIAEAICEAGFDSFPLSLDMDESRESRKKKMALLRHEKEVEFWWNRFRVAVWLSSFLLLIMILDMIAPFRRFLAVLLFRGISIRTSLQFCLGMPVHIYSGWPFYVKAVAALRRWTSNMDVLVFVGANAAVGYSLIAVVMMLIWADLHEDVFFETSAFFLFFLTLGKYMESVATGKTTSSLVRLLELQPDFAMVVEEKNSSSRQETISTTERQVPIAHISPGDLVRVLPGSRIPVDGIIVHGCASVDESLITGESIPISKEPGQEVVGGSLNLDGSLLVETTRAGSGSTLSQIVRLVEEAQANKAPIQRYADWISSIFVPMVCTIALVTFLTWYSLGVTDLYPETWRGDSTSSFLFAFLFALSVLVISCPCAFGLATPTAVMVATGVAANMGILFKGGEPLETLHRSTVVVFDKTGTLTTGQFSVTDVNFVRGVCPLLDDASSDIEARNRFLSLVATAEIPSEHPLGIAIRTFCSNIQVELGPEPERFTALPGKGIATVLRCPHLFSSEAIRVDVGRSDYMRSQFIFSPQLDDSIQRLHASGKTTMVVSIDGIACGCIGLMDSPRPEAAKAISTLQSNGISCFLITGDHVEAAALVGKRVGIPRIRSFAGVFPGQKAEMIQQLRREGHSVVFVGDGINDAPALSSSDVGIAIGCGTHVAVDSASVVLMRNELSDVVAAIDLARITFRRIKLNYAWALGYNLLMIPLAAGLFYPLFPVRLPPYIAGACMMLSSLSVIASSLLLQTYERPDLSMFSCALDSNRPLQGIKIDQLSSSVHPSAHSLRYRASDEEKLPLVSDQKSLLDQDNFYDL